MQGKKLIIANTPEAPLCTLLITVLDLLIRGHPYPQFYSNHLFFFTFLPCDYASLNKCVILIAYF